MNAHGNILTVSVFCLGLVACIPTASRKNAKLKPGVAVELLAGVQSLGEGVDEDGAPTQSKSTTHFEADIQWATLFEDKSGLAIQLKVPWSIVYSSLDLYYQLPPTEENVYLGVGAELGGFYGGYFAATYYLKPKVFLTVTPRLLRISATENTDGSLRRPASYQYSGQVALGLGGSGGSISAFLMAAHQTGTGFDIDVDLFGSNGLDYRKDYGLIGISIRR